MLTAGLAEQNPVEKGSTWDAQGGIIVSVKPSRQNLVLLIRRKALDLISVSPYCHPEGFGHLWREACDEGQIS